MKAIYGLLLILALAVIPVSASVIANPPADATLIDPTGSWTADNDGQILDSVLSGNLDVTFAPSEATMWEEDFDDYGPPIDNAVVIPEAANLTVQPPAYTFADSLTMDFTDLNALTEFGFWATPYDNGTEYNIQVAFYSPSDTLLADYTTDSSLSQNLTSEEPENEYTGWYFFGYQTTIDQPIGSVVVTTTDPGGMLLSEMEYQDTPEPTSFLLLAGGLFGLGLASRRRLGR